MRLWRLFFCVILFTGLLIFPSCSRKTDETGTRTKTNMQTGPMSEEVDRLVKQLLIGKEERKQARDTLIALGNKATKDLITHLDSPEMTVRWEVVNIIGYTHDAAGMETLINCVLRDNNPHVRWRSIWALSGFKDPIIAERFRANLDNEDKTVAWNAAIGGSMFKVQESLPALHSNLNATDDFMSWEATNALSRINDASSVGFLRKVLEGNAHKLRREAIMSLGKMKYPDVNGLLIEYLDDEDPEVRWRVAMAMTMARRISDNAVRKAAENRFKVEKNDMVIKHLSKIVKKVGSAKKGKNLEKKR